jgi:hypothetical protein
VSTPLSDPSLLDEDDLVGVSNGAQPVCDHKARPSAQKLVQRILDEELCTRVHTGGRLIHDQDAWPGQDSARNGDQLSLSLAQVATLLGQLRLVALREPADEVVGVG